jgi:hypothetical protein
MTVASIIDYLTNKISSLFITSSTSAAVLDIKLALTLIAIACFLSALALVALVISHIRLKQKFQAKVEGIHPSTTHRLPAPSRNPRQAQ